MTGVTVLSCQRIFSCKDGGLQAPKSPSELFSRERTPKNMQLPILHTNVAAWQTTRYDCEGGLLFTLPGRRSA